MESLEMKDTMAGPDEPIKSEGIVPSPDTSERSNGAASPPPNCSICLGKLVNTSFTDSCLHQFCFTCLLQWSKIKTECPLCKQTFKSIIHNVRSEEDYDQYHVQYTSQVAATLDVTADINISGHWDAVGVGIPIRPFMYRTTMGGGNRRYGVYLNPEAVARREQIPSVAPQLSSEERRHRTANPNDYRRTVYRQGIRAASLPDAFGRFRVSSAEYYRRHPSEVDRLIPWLNRELQVLLNNNRPHIAYVMQVITDHINTYDIYSVEFRDIVRPYFGIHTEHFIHEFLNYARSNFDLVGYDQAVTYMPNRGLSNEYVSRAISPTLSTSSSSSSDSDIRILNDGLGNNRYDPRYLDMPGPSTVGQAFRIQLPYTAPDILTISSTSSSSENECEIIGYVKPRHERTPEIVDLSSSEAEVNAASSQSTSASTSHENTQTEALLPLKEENLPSTSSSGNNHNSRQTRRRTEDIIKSKMFDYYLDSSSAESDREEIDSDYNPSSTKPRRHKGAPKKSSKKVTRKLRSRKRKRTTAVQRKRTKTRTRSSYSSFCSDNESPPRAASSSRGTKRYLPKNSDESGNDKITQNKRSKKAKCSKTPKRRITASTPTSKAVCHYSSNSSSSYSDSDSEAENNKSKRRLMKSSAITNSSHCTSSDDRSGPEKASNTARQTRRRTDSRYSDTDPSDYRRSESSRHSSVESPGNRDNWPLLNTDSSLRNTSEEEVEKKEEEEESRSPVQSSSSASSDDPSSCYKKKTNSSKSMTAVTTTSDASTSQATSQSSERLSSAAATSSTTTTTASSASASSLKSNSPTEHSPSSSKTTRERHRSHKKRKESKKRRRSHS